MSNTIQTIDADAYRLEVLEHDGPVAVDFYSTECAPCEALAAKYQAASELYGQDVKFIKIFRQENRELAERLGVRASPTVLFFERGHEVGNRLTGSIKRADLLQQLDRMVGPDRAREIRRGLRRTRTECDVLIIGGGPAGITAGIYAAQAKLRTIIVDRGLAGGNLWLTHSISNYPGFPQPLPGYQLADLMRAHALAAGAQLREAADITRVDLDASEVELDELETIRARRIVLATGSSPRPLGIKGEREYIGRGVSYCATCDAKYYGGKHVVVIGGGNSAVEESLLIAKFAARVTVVHQFDHLQANQQAQQAAFANDRIDFVWSHEPREFVAENGGITGVVVEDLKTGVHRRIDCDGVFVFVGMNPNLGPFEDALSRDQWGYLRVDEELRTNLPHVYGAGDVRGKRYRQMTTAVGDGTVAAMAIARELGV
jgi:thioredoxin reductase (NADPH)